MLLSLSAGLLGSVLSLSAAERIRIDSQAGFDRLEGRLGAWAVEAGDSLILDFVPGAYRYGEGHLSLDHFSAPGLCLAINGNGSVFIPKGDEYALDSPSDSFPLPGGYSISDGFVDLDRCAPVDVRDERMIRCRTYPVPVLFRKGVFRIKTRAADLSEQEASDCYLLLSQWYVGAVYKVLKIRRGWIFFRRTDVGTWIYSELRFGRCLPRYLLYNTSGGGHPYVMQGALRSENAIHIARCRASSFLEVNDTMLRSLVLKDCRFVSNRDGEPLVRFSSLRCSGETPVVSGCSFEGIKGPVLHVSGVQGLRIARNVFDSCYREAVIIESDARDVSVVCNRFTNQGKMLTNAPAVRCKGSGFRISDNRFIDFSYSAIGLGKHYSEEGDDLSSGIVYRNEICQSVHFRDSLNRYLIDSGAIYIWTRNRDVLLCNNHIHDIFGPHGNRGILCDDGTVHVSVYGNRIERIANSYCIDLRIRPRIGRVPGSRISRVNVGNRMSGNQVDGKCRFEIRRDDPDSYKGQNFQIPKS